MIQAGYNTSFLDIPAVQTNDAEAYLDIQRNALWSIVKPYNGTIYNYVLNPSSQTGSSTYWHNDPNTNNATVSVAKRTTTNQYLAYKGMYSIKVTANVKGNIYGVVQAPASFGETLNGSPISIQIPTNTIYYLSAYVRANSGDLIILKSIPDGVFAPTIPDLICNKTTIVANGEWQRITTTVINQRPGSVAIGMAIQCVPASTNVAGDTFYVDLAMISNINASDYFDGSTSGATWIGGSSLGYSKYDGRTYRVIGEEIGFKDVGFMITGWNGMNMPSIKTITSSYGSIGGSHYLRTVFGESRKVSLIGYLESCKSYVEQQRKLNRLNKTLALANGLFSAQPIILRYRLVDRCGCIKSEQLDLECVYTGGAEGATTSPYNEKFTLNFESFEDLTWRGRIDCNAFPGTARTVCYSGSAPTPFAVSVEANVSDAHVYSIANNSSGGIVYFNQNNTGFLTVPAGQRLVFGDFDRVCGSAVLFDMTTGSFISNVADSILRPNSIIAKMQLLPDENNLKAVVNGVGTYSLYACWRNRHLSISDAVNVPNKTNPFPCLPVTDPITQFKKEC